MKKTRRKFSSAFKAKVALSAIQERETLSDLSKKFEVHPNIILKWKKEFIELSDQVFEKEPLVKEPTEDVELLYSKIGKLEVENDFLKKSLKKAGL